MGTEAKDIFGWLDSMGELTGPISDNHQRFLNFMAGRCERHPQSSDKMPITGWDKLYQKWLDGTFRPHKDELTADPKWECLPK